MNIVTNHGLYRNWIHPINHSSMTTAEGYLNFWCLSIKSTLFPPFFPRMSYLDRRSWKRWQKVSKTLSGRRVQSRNQVTTYAVAFAISLSLVGAGLLLGWTFGWIFPPL